MITEQLDKLNDAGKAFLEDKAFGAIEIEEVTLWTWHGSDFNHLSVEMWIS